MAEIQDGPVRRRRREKFVAGALIAGVMAVALWVHGQYIAWAGFPDGFMSELDRAENQMAIWFCWFSVVLVAALTLLIGRSFAAGIARWLLVVVGLYVLAIGGVIGLDQHFRTYKMDSAGG